MTANKEQGGRRLLNEPQPLPLFPFPPRSSRRHVSAPGSRDGLTIRRLSTGTRVRRAHASSGSMTLVVTEARGCGYQEGGRKRQGFYPHGARGRGPSPSRPRRGSRTNISPAAQKGFISVMTVIALILGSALTSALIGLARNYPPGRERRVYAVGVVVAALVYIVVGVAGGAGARWLALELLGVFLCGTAAWGGLRGRLELVTSVGVRCSTRAAPGQNTRPIGPRGSASALTWSWPAQHWRRTGDGTGLMPHSSGRVRIVAAEGSQRRQSWTHQGR